MKLVAQRFKPLFLIVLLLFFGNRLLLPFGLQYATVFAPAFLYFLYSRNELHKTLVLFTAIIAIGLLQITTVVNFSSYIVSTVILLSLVLFTHAFYLTYRQLGAFDSIVEKLVKVNAGLTILALVFLFIEPLKGVLWYLIPFTDGYKTLPRLKLFELEASHYSLLLLPLFFYYLWTLLHKLSRKNILLFGAICLSLILSFSMGIIAVIAIGTLATLILRAKSFVEHKNSRNILQLVVTGFTILGFLLYVFFPENPLYFRIGKVLSGEDTSGRGRTYEAFQIGWEVLTQHGREWFGIGLGQFKLLGRETLLKFYEYQRIPEVVRLPNSMAETMVAYGLFGMSLKLFIQAVLFLKLKVWNNLFQLSIFIALFVYQFTGSYLSNSMEYVLWVIAFTPQFVQFNKENYLK